MTNWHDEDEKFDRLHEEGKPMPWQRGTPVGDRYKDVSTKQLMNWLIESRKIESVLSHPSHVPSPHDAALLERTRARIARLREALSTREHIPNKAERRQMRQQKAKQARGQRKGRR